MRIMNRTISVERQGNNWYVTSTSNDVVGNLKNRQQSEITE